MTVTSERTAEVRTATTNEAGTFTMIAVQPDTYHLRIEQRGFKAHERRGVSIAANEKVSFGDVTLQVGDVTETISVVGEAAQVQTDSSQHSAVLTSTQLTNLTAKGREVVSMLHDLKMQYACPSLLALIKENGPDILRPYCERGDGESCFISASLYYAGGGVPKRPEAAVTLFRQSCTDGWSRGCGALRSATAPDRESLPIRHSHPHISKRPAAAA